MQTRQDILQYFAAHGWRIVGTQVPVQDPARRDLTQVDVVCVDAAGARIVIEVKTRIVTLDRHTQAYKEVNPAKPRGLEKLPNSLYWRHQIQLRKTAAMYRRACPRGTTIKAHVIVAVGGTVIRYPLALKYT